MSEERLEDLSERLLSAEQALAHLEVQMEEINGVVTDQWKIIDGLKRQNARLQDRLEQMENRPVSGAPDQERPPHY